MSREAHEIALQAWIQAVVSGFDGDAEFPVGHNYRAYYSDQANPRVTKPYATLLVTGDSATGEPDISSPYSIATDEIAFTIVQRRQGNVSVRTFGPKHGEVARALELSVYRQDIINLNRSNGLTIAYTATAPRRLSIDTDGVIDDRTLIEFAFRFVSSSANSTPDYLEGYTLTQVE